MSTPSRDIHRIHGRASDQFAEAAGKLLLALPVVLWGILARPRLSGPLLIAGVLWWQQGPATLALFALLLVTVLVVWLMLDRKSWVRLVYLPARSGLRRLWVYQPRWTRVMRGCKLTTTHRGSERVPKLKRVRCDKTTRTDRLLVELLEGQAPEDLAKVSEGIRHSYRADSCRVRAAEKPGETWVLLRKGEPLANVIPALPIPASVDLERVPAGVTEDGDPWQLSVRGAAHLLLAGSTGAGKSGVLWSLLRGLAPAIRDDLVQVWAIDPKGGMELGPGEGLFARFESGDPQAMAKMLEDLVKWMERRQAQLHEEGIRTFEPSPGDPVVLVIVDEIAAISAYISDKDAQKRIAQALATLLTQGRGPGFVVIGALQDPREEVLKLRNLFPTKVAMQLEEARQVDMVLGQGSRERGARCDEIPDSLRGVGYVKVDGRQDPVRVRSAYVTDADIAAMVAEYAPRGGEVVELSSEVVETLRKRWQGPGGA